MTKHHFHFILILSTWRIEYRHQVFIVIAPLYGKALLGYISKFQFTTLLSITLARQLSVQAAYSPYNTIFYNQSVVWGMFLDLRERYHSPRRHALIPQKKRQTCRDYPEDDGFHCMSYYWSQEACNCHYSKEVYHSQHVRNTTISS